MVVCRKINFKTLFIKLDFVYILGRVYVRLPRMYFMVGSSFANSANMLRLSSTNRCVVSAFFAPSSIKKYIYIYYQCKFDNVTMI